MQQCPHCATWLDTASGGICLNCGAILPPPGDGYPIIPTKPLEYP